MNQRTMICAGRVTTGPERKRRVKRLMLYHREEKASQKIKVCTTEEKAVKRLIRVSYLAYTYLLTLGSHWH